MIPENSIICGAMPEATKVFPNGYFNCCISSPPYWALRDYGVDGQLGLEKTFEEYIDKLCTIYDEVKRVLRDDGTCWVNLGDTYSNTSCGGGSPVGERKGRANCAEAQNKRKFEMNLPQKSLCLIPQRFAIEMVNRGWILRNVIIWHKPNPMPSSAKDRFTVDFEYVYFFVKSKKYWFEPQYEPLKDPEDDLRRVLQRQQINNKKHDGSQKSISSFESWSIKNPKLNTLGRNKRTVWTIPTQSFPEAHFATFPEKLVEPMIKAGCPEFVCTKCGKAREKIYKPTEEYAEKLEKSKAKGGIYTYVKNGDGFNYGGKQANASVNPERIFKGYTDCGCNADFRPGIVIDIFAGSGTSLQVAARLRRDWIGIELKPEYIEMAEKRAQQGETGIPVREQNIGQQPLFPVDK